MSVDAICAINQSTLGLRHICFGGFQLGVKRHDEQSLQVLNNGTGRGVCRNRGDRLLSTILGRCACRVDFLNHCLTSEAG